MNILASLCSPNTGWPIAATGISDRTANASTLLRGKPLRESPPQSGAILEHG